MNVYEFHRCTHVAFTADQHVGNHRRLSGPVESGLNRRCRQHVAVLSAAMARAVEEGCSLHVGLGDMFDSAHPRPQLVDAVLRALGGIDNVLLVGNHDHNTFSERDHAIGALHPVATVVEHTSLIVCGGGLVIAAVPFQSSADVAADQWLPQEIKRCLGIMKDRGLADTPLVIATHVGIKDDSFPPYMKASSGAVSVEVMRDVVSTSKAVAVISGDWHEHRSWGRGRIIQCGALAPTGWDNLSKVGADDPYGSLYVYDIARAQFEPRITIPGPRFFKSRDLADLTRGALRRGFDNYAEITCSRRDLDSVREEIARLCEAGLICAGEALPDRDGDDFSQDLAAMHVQNANTLPEAVAAYTAAMDLREDHEHLRDRVGAVVLEVLRGSGG